MKMRNIVMRYSGFPAAQPDRYSWKLMLVETVDSGRRVGVDGCKDLVSMAVNGSSVEQSFSLDGANECMY